MERASDYLDDALPPGDRERLEEHLAACAACARQVDRLRETLLGLHALPREPMPAIMKERLRQALHDRQSA